MALSFVFFSIAVFYIAEKIREQLVGKIGEYVMEKIEEYVAVPIGDYLDTPIGRQLGYLLSLAVLYVAGKSRETLEEKIIEYVVSPVRDYMVAPIGRELGYLFFYNSNIEDFRTRRENLRNTRDVVRGRVDDAKKNGEVILPHIREWQTNVNKVIEESRNIFDDEHQLNLKLRYQRSRNAKKKTSDVDKLTREGNSFDRVSTYALAFESRKLIFNKIMEAVKDDGIGMIGIYGMGGVGKSTLAKEVQQQAKDVNLFDVVVMPVVSQPPDLKRIQGEIADMLRLKLDAESIPGRAGQLSEELEKKERVLIILDDIWEIVELEAIGIPFGAKHKGCKILLTSRRQDVCIHMGTRETFSVEALSGDEGWELFRKMAGESVDSPDLYPLAVEIANECAGLPLAIVTLARALKGKHSFDWRAAATQLRKSIPDDKIKSSLELSYNLLKSEEAKEFFLLCCLFPEDWNIEIEDLMKYGMGLGLFQNVDTVDEAKEMAYSLAYYLKSSCLLQDGRNEETVKMHDVIRDVAISIASNGKHVFLVRAGPGWKEFPGKDTYKSYTAMSLVSDDIHELPGELDCPELQITYLECPHPSLQFPDNFFLRMKNLKVLDMSGMRFLSLPTSLRYLENLRTLCLDRCILEDLSIIGELKKLEILSFMCSQIKQLSKEVGMLTQLRLLDLTGSENLTVIPPDVIRGLSRLEGLCMDCDFDKWEIEEQDEERSNASLAELKHLSSLINLEILIPDADLLPDDLIFRNLSRFKISVGTRFKKWGQYYSCSKILFLDLNVSTGLKDGVKVLLKKVECLILTGMEGLKSVIYDLDREGFQNLRLLFVRECSEVEYIFNASERALPVAFPILEKLHLIDLPHLREICHGQLPSGFFSKLQELLLYDLPVLIHLWKDPAQRVCLHNLTVVGVYDCGGLKNLFSLSVANELSKLVKLTVTRCKIMEEIFGNENETASAAAVDDIVFPHLRSLELGDLPNLRNFCSKIKGNLDTHTGQPLFDKKVSFPQLKVLEVFRCHKVSKVVQFNLLPTLEELIVEGCNSLDEVVEVEVEGLVVETLNQLRQLKLCQLPKLKHIMRCEKYPHRILGFRNLSYIDIFECNSLKSLFSPSQASSLLQLQGVEIHSCKMMESIIAEDREGEENCKEIIVFPHLCTLEFQNLPKLVGFMKTFTSIFSIQQKHMIEDEIELKEAAQEVNLGDPIQPLFDQKVTLPTIKVLKIKGLDKVKDIWHPQIQAESFCQLKVLEVESCHKISNVIPSNLLKHLTNLEEVSIEECDSVEIIFEVEWLSVEDRRGTMTLSQLRKLRLSGLPKLFASKHPILQKLQMDDEESKGKPDESNSSIPIRPLFEEWVAFTNLVELHIFNIENLQEIFHTRLADESFSQLRILSVTKCHKLSRVAPSNLLLRLQNLEKLSVEGCNSMEKIFELEGEGHIAISLFQLEYVDLIDLPSLLMFCSGKYDFELPSLLILDLKKCPKMQTFSSGLKSTPNLESAYAGWGDGVWKGDLNSTIHDIFQEEEIKECLYVIKDLVYGLHLREQESSVQEDEDKDQDEEVGEILEEANTEEQERDENISARAIHHEIQEAAEEEGHQKGSLEAIREHLKVMMNLLEGLGFHEPEHGVEEKEDEEEEEEEESEKSGQANIEELQEIFVHLKGVIKLVNKGGLRKRKHVVVIREHLKRMMDLVPVGFARAGA